MNNDLNNLAKLLSHNSIFILFFKKMYAMYHFLEIRFDNIFKNSITNRLIRKFRQNATVILQNSFLNKIIQLNISTILDMLKKDKRTIYLINAHRVFINNFVNCFSTSKIINSTNKTIENFYFSPLKLTGMIIVITILSNIVFSVFLDKRLGLLGWFVRILFLFLGIIWMFCGINWQTLKNNSIIFKVIKRNES